MCVHHHDRDSQSTASAGPSRRGFLRSAALAGAGAAALGAVGAPPALAAGGAGGGSSGDAGRWDPDPNSRQFTLAVMPDTQFLYWGTQNSINSVPQEASFRYVIDNSGEQSSDNIVFMAHLGDL